jgi:hypothetical protein
MRRPQLFLSLVLSAALNLSAANRTLIFPQPQEQRLLQGNFELTEDTVIAVPLKASPADLALARMLREELIDRWGIAVGIRRLTALPARTGVILAGALTNPLVAAYSAAMPTVHDRASAYFLHVTERVALVAGSDDEGAFYGLQSLRQLVSKHSNGLAIPGIQVRDWPYKPFRGIRMYLPGRNNISFFKRFVRDFMALYKFNKLILEVNACMRLDRHPELNAGWVEFGRDVNYARRNYPTGVPHEMDQNSSHQDAGDGGYLEQDEVRELVAWARKNHLDVIPEVPSYSHSFYLLARHPELSEVPGERWPDTYCPSNPATYKLLFDVLDEYIEVMKPSMVHIGHDEAFAPLGTCPRCKGKDVRELYAQDVTRLHDYLAKRGIRTAMWADMLLENVRGKGPRNEKAPDGYQYKVSGALTPELARSLPHDILLFNWFWDGRNSKPNEEQLEKFGFEQIYGNLEPNIADFASRSVRGSLRGGVASSWQQTTEPLFGKDLILSFLGCQSLLWSNRALGTDLPATVQAMIPEVRRRLRGEPLPSELGDTVVPIDISSRFNMPARETVFDVDFTGVGQAIMVGTEGAEKNPMPREVDGIPVSLDATSLLFLHACARPATNKLAYRTIWDMEDTADLLGWYEVIYDDGFVTTIPIRYGVHLLEWNWHPGQPVDRYCYGADPVSNLFVYEWTNPRLGKVVKEVRLKGTTGFRGAVPGFENAWGPVIPNNAVILKALSAVIKRSDADSQRLRWQHQKYTDIENKR